MSESDRGETVRWPLVGRHDEFMRALAGVTEASATVLVTGPPGVGRSRLLAEVATAAQRAGRCVTRVTAPAATATDPFAALTPLLDDSGQHRDAAAVARELAARSQGKAQLLVIDDAQWLDDATVAAIALLRHHRRVSLLLSVPDGDQPASQARSALADDVDDVVTLSALPAPAIDQLLSGVSPEPLSTTARAELRHLSQGLPGPLRALLAGAVGAGRLRLHDGLWHPAGALAATPHARAYADRVFATLSEQLRAGFDLAALTPVWHAELLEHVVGLDALIELETHRLLAVDGPSAGTPRLRISPLHREVVTAGWSWARRRHLHRQLVEIVETVGGPGWPDLAEGGYHRWRAGLPAPPDGLLAAAARARQNGDTDLALAIAGTATTAASLDGAICQAECLAAAGRLDEAEQAFATARQAAATDDGQVRVVLAATQHLHLRRHDGRQARELLRSAAQLVRSPEQRDSLQAMEMAFISFAGDQQGARAGADELVARWVDDTAGAAALTISTFAATVLGHPEAAIAQLDEHAVAATLPPDGLPLVPAQLGINRMFAQVAVGEVEEAVEHARHGYHTAMDDDPADSRGTWMACLAFALLEHGAVAEGERLAVEGSYELERRDPLGVLPAALSLRAYAAALQRDVRAARSTLAMLDGQFGDQHRFVPWRDRAELWCLAAEGDRARVLDHAATAASRTRSQQLELWATWFELDLVRLGEPAPVLATLEVAEATVECCQVQLAAEHARALAGRDACALEHIGSRYRAAGWRLYAAEALAQAATIHHRDGADRAAARAAGLAQRLLVDCPGARTARLVAPPPVLTAREREVARLAATGLTSREIAHRLVISIRTVDNHLHRCYRKLGIDGRDELPALV